MSEYQYYEFQAIDARLTEGAQRDLRKISSRATITATSFTNTYSWGDLRGDPHDMLARWFDAMLHVANWGTRWLAFRLPVDVLSPKDLASYKGWLVSIKRQGEFTCVHLHLQPEDSGSDWLDGEDLLGSLLPLRDALAGGDYRCLYLAWLVDLHWGYVDDDAVEPPVPPGLADLDPAHEAFVELMAVDPDLLGVAAHASAPIATTEPTRAAAGAWLAKASRQEKDDWLLEVMLGNASKVQWELRNRLRNDAVKPAQPTQAPRTAGQLMRRAEAHAERRMMEQARAQAEKRERDAAQKLAARQRRLDTLTGQESDLWKQVDELIDARAAKSYDEAICLITDLRGLADRTGERPRWEARCAALRQTHYTKRAFIRRLDEMLRPRPAGRVRRGSRR